MQWDNKREELEELHLGEDFPASAAQDLLDPIPFSEDIELVSLRDTVTADASSERNLFAWAVSGSLVLHAGMVLALISFRVSDRAVATLEAENKSVLEAIAVSLVVQNPQRAEQLSPAEPSDSNPQATEQLPEEDQATLADQVAEQAAELHVPLAQESSDDTVLEQLIPTDPAITPPAIAEPVAVSDAEASPSRLIPSVSAMRSSIQRVNEQRRSRDWMQQCNPLQEEAQLIECGESEPADYSAATANSTYLALNPTFTATREQRSISTITLNRETLLAQLEDADTPAWMKDYARQQLEISISDESRFVNRTVDQIHQMTEQGDAAANARMMFGDAWLLDTMRKDIQRNVHREAKFTGNKFSGSQ